MAEDNTPRTKDYTALQRSTDFNASREDTVDYTPIPRVPDYTVTSNPRS